MPHRDVVALVPAPTELAVERVQAEPNRLVVVVRARRREVRCPACGCRSRRVHSHYERHLADLPWHGVAIALHLRVRRFRCDLPRCPHRIVCERLPGTTVAYARRTTRLARALAVIGLARGGEAEERLARALSLDTGASADTLLRLLKAQPAASAPAPPVRVLAWMIGRGGTGSAMARSSSISSGEVCSICCPIASRPHSRRGSACIPRSRSSAATARGRTPKARWPARPERSK